MRTVEKYQCEYCGKEFDTEEECHACEESHIIDYSTWDNAELAKELKYLSRIANGYRFGNEVMGMPLRNFKCLLDTAACKLEEKA